MYNFCSSSAETFNIVRLILAKYAERPFDAYLHSVVEQIRELVSFKDLSITFSLTFAKDFQQNISHDIGNAN